MLTKDEFDLCIGSFTDGALMLVTENKIEAAMAMIGGLPDMCWDLCRPGVDMERLDLTDRLSEIHGASDRVAMLEMCFVTDEDGKPILGFGHGKHQGGEPVDVSGKGLPRSVHEGIGRILEEVTQERGFTDDQDSSLTSLTTLLKQGAEKNIDAEVEKFSSELDSLFETWGGEDSG